MPRRFALPTAAYSDKTRKKLITSSASGSETRSGLGEAERSTAAAAAVQYADEVPLRRGRSRTPMGARTRISSRAMARPRRSSTGRSRRSAARPGCTPAASADGRLDAVQVAELWRQVRDLEANAQLRATDRMKGTGAFWLTDAAGTRDFIILRGPALLAFDELVQGSSVGSFTVSVVRARIG